MGEVDIVDSLRPKDEPPAEIPFSEKPYLDCPYLILDVRDKDSYDACHIVGGQRMLMCLADRGRPIILVLFLASFKFKSVPFRLSSQRPNLARTSCEKQFTYVFQYFVTNS